MPDYVPPAIETDGLALKEQMIALLLDRIPGLALADAHPLNFVFEAVGEVAAELLLQVLERFDYEFEQIGESLVQEPIRGATQASGFTTWTRVDDVGDRIIPAGTSLTLLGADGSRVGFFTRNEVTIPNGDLTTAVGEVEILAAIAGAAGTGLLADPQPEDALAWLDDIDVVSATTGGTDGEDRVAYRNRLRGVYRLLGRTLVIAEDYAVDAYTSFPEVYRALALDLYDPDTDTDGNEGFMTVAVVNEDGADPGSTVRNNGEAEQAALSVAQMTVNWIAPTVTDVDVTFAAKCYPEFDPADVELRAEAAVAAFLSPATWGLPASGDQRAWIDRPIVRYRDVVTAIENVEGLDYTTAVTIREAGGVLGTTDVTLDGPAALPNPGAVLGTVTAP